jgi:hypothetical protein
MEGKELLALLDLLKEFWEESQKMQRLSDEEIEMKSILKARATAYAEVSKKLEAKLRELNS